MEVLRHPRAGLMLSLAAVSQPLYVLAADGRGARELFRSPASIAVPARLGVRMLAPGDFDRDRTLDLVAATGGANVAVLFQDPHDRMRWTTQLLRVGLSCETARVGDLDGDRVEDLVRIDGVEGVLRTALLAREPLRVRREGSVSLCADPVDLFVGRIDADALADALVACRGGNSLAFARGDGSGEFLPAQSIATVKGPKGALAGDWNGDGRVDLAALAETSLVLHFADAADADDSGALDLSDVIYSLTHLFMGGPAPPAPFPDCGADPTQETPDLGCDKGC